MKKILIMFLTLFISINTVKANEWQEEFIEGENVESEYRYRFYKEVENGEYVRRDLETNHQYKELDNIKYGEYVDYQSSCPTGEGYETKYATKYVYQELISVGYIKITNLSDYDLEISNISIFKQSEDRLIDFTFNRCTKCTNNYSILNSRGSLIIKMSESVYLRDLILEFDFLGESSNYEILYSANGTFAANDFIAMTRGDANTREYYYNDSYFLYYNYTSTKVGYDIEVDNFITVKSTEKVCRAREIMDYRYNIDRVYYDDNYYKDVSLLSDLSDEERELYQKDLEDYKIFYRSNEVLEQEDDVLKQEEDDITNTDIDLDLEDEDVEIKLVKTGVEGKIVNYKYLIIYILSLMLIASIILKHIKRMSIKNKN